VTTPKGKERELQDEKNNEKENKKKTTVL